MRRDPQGHPSGSKQLHGFWSERQLELRVPIRARERKELEAWEFEGLRLLSWPQIPVGLPKYDSGIAFWLKELRKACLES